MLGYWLAAALPIAGACGDSGARPGPTNPYYVASQDPANPQPPSAANTPNTPAAPPPRTLEEPSFGRGLVGEQPISQGKKAVRTIHPQPGQTGCVEMYGDCTPEPNSICTSKALYIDCGKQALVPSTGEPVDCVCP